MTPADIIESGLQHVETYLKGTGYTCHHTPAHHGSVDIEARGEDDKLYVHVMSTLAPTAVPDISTSDLARVLSRAMTMGYDSWLAKVQVDAEGELVGEIQWSQLNH